jgi:hypothetical protein
VKCCSPWPQWEGEYGVGPTWPAMQDEQHRVIAVLATDLDPLIDFTDPDKPFLDDPVRSVDHERLGHTALPRLAVDQPTGDRHGRYARCSSHDCSDHVRSLDLSCHWVGRPLKQRWG